MYKIVFRGSFLACLFFFLVSVHPGYGKDGGTGVSKQTSVTSKQSTTVKKRSAIRQKKKSDQRSPKIKKGGKQKKSAAPSVKKSNKKSSQLSGKKVSEKRKVPLLSHEKEYYTSPGGRLFVPGSLPVFLHLSPSPDPQNSTLLQKEGKKHNKKPIFLKEGKNQIRHPFLKSLSYDFYVDKTSPETTLKYLNAPQFTLNKNLILAQTLKLDIQSKDKLAGVKDIFISINGKPYQSLNKVPLKFDDGKKYEIWYYAVDKVGNIEPPKSVIFWVDGSSPVTQLVYKGSTKDNILSETAYFQLNPSDSLSTVSDTYFGIDTKKLQPYKDNISLEELPEGKHVIYYQSKDRVKNLESLKSHTFYYDRTPPGATVQVEGNQYKSEGVFYISRQSKVKITPSDNIAGVKSLQVQVDDLPAFEYSKPFHIEGEAGIHVVRYITTDQVNNRTERIARVFLDSVPPFTQPNLGGDGYWNGDTVIINKKSTISLASTDLESHVKEIRYCINKKSCGSYKTPLSFPKEGTYELTYYAVDHVKNTEKVKTLSIKVEKEQKQKVATQKIETPKQWILDKKLGVTGAKGLDFFLKISDTPDDSGQSFLIEVQTPKHKKGDVKGAKALNKPLSFVRKGKNTIKVDLAGFAKMFSVSIDGDAPATDVTLKGAKRYRNKGKMYYSAGLNMTLAAKEQKAGIQSGVDKIYYSINNSKFVTYKEPVSLFYQEQDYNVRYYAVDRVGNVEKTVTQKWAVDITAPKTTYTIQKPFFGKTFSSKSRIVFKSSDGLSGVEALYFTFDNKAFKVYTPKRFINEFKKLKEGRHHLSFYAKDHVGNLERTNSLAFKMDHTPPSIKFWKKGSAHRRAGKNYVASNVKFYLSASEKLTLLKSLIYQVDKQSPKSFKKAFSLPRKEGLHQIRYYASDVVDNQTRPVSRSYYVDLTPPNTELKLMGVRHSYNGQTFISGKTRIVLDSKDRWSGTRYQYYQVSKGRRTRYRRPVRISRTGPVVFKYHAVDNVNNTERQKRSKFFVDSISPNIRVNFSRPPRKVKGVYHISKDTSVYISTDDEHTGIKEVFYQINNGEKKLYRGSISNFKRQGKMVLKIQAVDWVDNIRYKTITYKVQ